MNKCEMTAHEMNNLYSSNYDQLRKDILEAVEDGFREGVREGVKEGMLYALNEVIDLKILDIKKERIRSLDEILQLVASESLESLANSRTTHEVCPVLRSWLERRCDEAIRILIDDCKIVTARNVSDLMMHLNLEDLADKKSQEISSEAKKKLPQSFVVSSIFNGLYRALWSCTKESVKMCNERIKETVASLHSQEG
jgi:hypothetical protein